MEIHIVCRTQRFQFVQYWLFMYLCMYVSLPLGLFLCVPLSNSLCVLLFLVLLTQLSVSSMFLRIFCSLCCHLVAQGYLFQLISKVNYTAQGSGSLQLSGSLLSSEYTKFLRTQLQNLSILYTIVSKVLLIFCYHLAVGIVKLADIVSSSLYTSMVSLYRCTNTTSISLVQSPL